MERALDSKVMLAWVKVKSGYLTTRERSKHLDSIHQVINEH